MSIAITSYERIKQSKKKPSQKQHERLDRFWQQMMNTNMQTLRRGKGGAPQKNQNAVTHGFFSKFLPEETLEIMEEIQERSPADMIWDQIQIQYAAIIRAQKIMFVSDKEEMIKELKKKRSLISEVSEIEDGLVISFSTWFRYRLYSETNT